MAEQRYLDAEDVVVDGLEDTLDDARVGGDGDDHGVVCGKDLQKMKRRANGQWKSGHAAKRDDDEPC